MAGEQLRPFGAVRVDQYDFDSKHEPADVHVDFTSVELVHKCAFHTLQNHHTGSPLSGARQAGGAG